MKSGGQPCSACHEPYLIMVHGPLPLQDDHTENNEAINFKPPAHWAQWYASQQATSLEAASVEDSWEFTDSDVVPPPANLPTNEEEVLYAPRRELWTLTDQPGIDLLLAGPAALEQLKQVHKQEVWCTWPSLLLSLGLTRFLLSSRCMSFYLVLASVIQRVFTLCVLLLMMACLKRPSSCLRPMRMLRGEVSQRPQVFHVCCDTHHAILILQICWFVGGNYGPHPERV